MRRALWFLAIAGPLLSAQSWAQSVTVAQLRQFLTSQHARNKPDSETAGRLSSAALSERLSEARLQILVRDTQPGPDTAEQLELLAEESVFLGPAAAELSSEPAPDPAAQHAMLNAALNYMDTALRRLPDFLAIRSTRRYNNVPHLTRKPGPKPKILLHAVGEFQRQIAYRNGSEVLDTDPAAAEPQAGLLSSGEFGPILSVVLTDSQHGEVAWSRWEHETTAGRLAVFRYSVPKSSSHYLVDFCCYWKSEDDPQAHEFRGYPAFHGELSLEPATGIIRRITVLADFEEGDPLVSSGIAVEYGNIEIGGRAYICPVRSVATTEIHNSLIEKLDGIGLERHINETRFLNYHKFGSTSRMLTDVP